MSEFCDFEFDGIGTSCRRCGCWRRGPAPPECPPWITRSEPDNARLPHIRTHEQNRAIHEAWVRLAELQRLWDEGLAVSEIAAQRGVHPDYVSRELVGLGPMTDEQADRAMTELLHARPLVEQALAEIEKAVPNVALVMARCRIISPFTRLYLLTSTDPALGGRSPLVAIAEGDVDAAADVVATYGAQGDPT